MRHHRRGRPMAGAHERWRRLESDATARAALSRPLRPGRFEPPTSCSSGCPSSPGCRRPCMPLRCTRWRTAGCCRRTGLASCRPSRSCRSSCRPMFGIRCPPQWPPRRPRCSRTLSGSGRCSRSRHCPEDPLCSSGREVSTPCRSRPPRASSPSRSCRRRCSRLGSTTHCSAGSRPQLPAGQGWSA